MLDGYVILSDINLDHTTIEPFERVRERSHRLHQISLWQLHVLVGRYCSVKSIANVHSFNLFGVL